MKGTKEILTYNRRQRNGLLLMVVLALILLALLNFTTLFSEKKTADFSNFEKAVADWQARDSLAKLENAPQLFAFDPNTASDSVLLKLGIPKRAVSSILNYRNKGGRFRKPQDLAKIYSLNKSDFQRVEPFVFIQDKFSKNYRRENYSKNDFSKKKARRFSFQDFDLNQISANQLEKMGLRKWEAERIVNYRNKVHPFETAEELYKIYHLDSAVAEKMIPFAKIETKIATPIYKEENSVAVSIEINSATLEDLEKLRGIGPSFGKRILKYRERLGGFHQKEQLLEVYGMDEERLGQFEEWVTFNDARIKKLNVNQATFKQLLRHPYLEYEMVKSIVNFREQVRPFKNVDELKDLEFLDESVVRKLKPYLIL